MHILILPTEPRGDAAPSRASGDGPGATAVPADGSVPVVRVGFVAVLARTGHDPTDGPGEDTAADPPDEAGVAPGRADRAAAGHAVGLDMTDVAVAGLVPAPEADPAPPPAKDGAAMPAGLGRGAADVPAAWPQAAPAPPMADPGRAETTRPPARGPASPPAHAPAPLAPASGAGAPTAPTVPEVRAGDPGRPVDPPGTEMPRARPDTAAAPLAAPPAPRARALPMADGADLPPRVEARLRATTARPAPAAAPRIDAPSPAAVPAGPSAPGGRSAETTGRAAGPEMMGIFEDPAAASDLRPGDRPGAERVFQASGPLAADRGAQTPPALARAVSAQLAEAARLDPGRPVEIRLEPQELGQVRMTLSLTDQGVTVAMSVERPETLELIRRHVDMLAQDFARLGLGTAGFSFARQDGGGDQAAGTPVSAGLAAQETTGETDAAQRITLRAATDGGMDIRL
ncbi:flagellar hook-length control protein FliK [Rhodovulum sp. YNF3179]|uniref:flagellar hook-length control protein FliK n=1 Tax=Rhodovulum sp. YNF3179 TaxID=3425127 RepID=UPI003D3356EE